MKNEKEILLQVSQHLQGLSKTEAFNIVAKMEALLFYAKQPIDMDNLKHIIISGLDEEQEDIDPFHFTILPNGNFCEFVGSNGVMHVYKEYNRVLPYWTFFTNYYFKTKYAPLELLKLNRKNIDLSFEGKQEANKMQKFLKKNSPTKCDVITSKPLILQV